MDKNKAIKLTKKYLIFLKSKKFNIKMKPYQYRYTSPDNIGKTIWS